LNKNADDLNPYSLSCWKSDHTLLNKSK